MEEKISGGVESVAYQNAETGFAVLDLDINGELVTAVGSLAGVAVGERLILYGEFVSHATYGRQFKAAAYERIMPSGAAAIEKYLSNGAIRGIGPTTAARLVKEFGDDTLEVLMNSPERTARIKGLSLKKAKGFSEELRRINGIRATLKSLAELGLDTADSLALFRVFAESTAEVVEDNPYMLCGFPLYKEFAFADSLGRALGFGPDAQNRVLAGIVYALRRNMRNGHTCVPVDELINKTQQFLGLSHDEVEIALYDAAEHSLIKIASANKTEYAFLPALYAAEKYISERIALLNSLEYKTPESPDKLIEDFEREHEIEYAERQREAIKLSLADGAVIVTGGPGTGKTTALNAIIELCERQGDKVLLAAPTGLAAKRLSALTGREAKTIHRLLEVQRDEFDSLKFIHNEENPLKCDVAVVDEMSMVDSQLFESLLRGLKPQCRLIMVGDFNQLPSVGAGNILRDMITSGKCPSAELTKIFRQAAKSLIVVNAHSIVAGEQPDIDSRDRDFFFLKCDKETAGGLIADLVARRLPASYGYDAVNDIQVLTPQRKGLSGAETLNDLLRGRLNPAGERKSEVRSLGRVFREGDKVMQIRNNYDIEAKRDDGDVAVGVFNGDIGAVERIDRASAQVTVLFDDRRAVYEFEQLSQLEAAYAVTIHKSQGSEFPAAVLALYDTNPRLCYRNLLYTAVTRARELLVIVGDDAVIERMVNNNRKTDRYTGLKYMLTGEMP